MFCLKNNNILLANCLKEIPQESKKNDLNEVPFMPVGQLTNAYVPIVGSNNTEYQRLGHTAMKYPVEPNLISIIENKDSSNPIEIES